MYDAIVNSIFTLMIKIYLHFKIGEVGRPVDYMNRDIKDISQWMRKHGLKINRTKMQPIILIYS